MKKVIALLLGLILTLSFVACSGGGKNSAKSGVADSASTNSGATAEDKDSILTEAGTFPIVKEKGLVTLTVFTHPTPEQSVDSYDAEDGNAFALWFEDLTNVKLDFIMAPSGAPEEIATALTMQISGGDIPDILLSNDFTPAQQQLYGNQGLLMEISDLVEKNAPRINKMWTDYPEVRKGVTLGDDKIYAVNYSRYPGHGATWNKMWVYKPWLDKLGMDVPTTTEEFYDCLVAFRDNDVNENGDKSDEIPLIGNQSWVAWDPVVYLMNSFIYNDFETNVQVDNGKVFAAYRQNEYKEGLAWINKLYLEGLISPETFTLTDMGAYVPLANQDPNIIGFMPSHAPFTAAQTEYNNFVPVPPLVGPSGQKNAMKNIVVPPKGALISADCEYPEVAIRVLDALFEPEVNNRAVDGIEGEGWRMAEEGELNSSGQQAKYYRFPFDPEGVVTKNAKWPMGLYFRNEIGDAGDTSVYANLDSMFAADPDAEDFITPLEKATIELYEPAFPDDSTLLPANLIYDDAVATEIADLQVLMDETVRTWRLRFILGEADLDTQWDAFLKELNANGFERYLEIVQQAYDAMK